MASQNRTRRPTRPAEDGSPFYCLTGNKEAEWPEFAPLEKRKLYQVPTVRGQFAFRIKAGVTGRLGSRGRKNQNHK